jgi:hypothetical protein
MEKNLIFAYTTMAGVSMLLFETSGQNVIE